MLTSLHEYGLRHKGATRGGVCTNIVVDSAFVFTCKALLLGIVYKQEHNTTRLFIVYYLTLRSCTDIIDDVSRIKAFKKLSLKVEVCEAVRSTRSTNNTCQ